MWDIIHHRINIVKYIYIKKKRKREKKNLQVEVNVDPDIKKLLEEKKKKVGVVIFLLFQNMGDPT